MHIVLRPVTHILNKLLKFVLSYFLLGSMGLFGFGWAVTNIDMEFPTSNNLLYLPILSSNHQSIPSGNIQRVNVPFIDVQNVTKDRFSEMAIFWYGIVKSTDNYTDVRIGYNSDSLFVYLATFDRLLWYDKSPNPSDFEKWDSVTLLVDTEENPEDKISLTSFRFDAQLNHWEFRDNYQAGYQGDMGTWIPTNIPFTTTAGYAGDSEIFNNSVEDRGWAMTYVIPFTSLGHQTHPKEGMIWRLALITHDRDDLQGTPIAEKLWPEYTEQYSPQVWGKMHFGYPSIPQIDSGEMGSISIRHKLNGINVPDAAIGGTTGNLCPGDSYYIWNEWGDANFGTSPDMNVQNQSNIADWPCFSKYYVTFPLDQIPANKPIISAKLFLHQWGNTGSFELARPSYIQISRVNHNWDDATLSWNNAPLALENVSQAWVDPVNCDDGFGMLWPCFPREWDVTYAINAALLEGKPLSLAVYSSDSDYHSGKLFTTSDTGDWNETGRPTLLVTWGE